MVFKWFLKWFLKKVATTSPVKKQLGIARCAQESYFEQAVSELGAERGEVVADVRPGGKSRAAPAPAGQGPRWRAAPCWRARGARPGGAAGRGRAALVGTWVQISEKLKIKVEDTAKIPKCNILAF